ncbi:MAG: o-succinylbenzoate synthase [Opitutae bacterium]|nr:o-succinylbenzoate synthase [Opitutae bacterium]MDG1300657.1 o-succinylbenzoate synthase [Opitutae bacterium]
MGRRFSFQAYQRIFTKPLRTARGAWSVRQGFIVCVEDESGVGYGEIAPIPEFGSETLAAAEAFLWGLVADSELADDVAALAALPCCAFGLSSAQGQMLSNPASVGRRNYEVAALLPAGAAGLRVLQAKLARGYETFKWKVGVDFAEVEQSLFQKMMARLPTGARLRLDANCGFSITDLESWLWVLQRYADQVEYLEQPLTVGQESLMAEYAESFGVPIALDESLNSAAGWQWLREWRGPLVVKPALMGDIAALVERLRPVAERVVISSVFETAVGLENTLRIADQLPDYKLAIGFDTLTAFADGLSPQKSAPIISAAERTGLTSETIWKQLPI